MADDIRASSLKMLDYRIQQVASLQVSLSSKVDDIKAKLSDPPDGLYIKNAQLRSDVDDIDGRIDKISTDISQLLMICEEQTKQVIVFENLLRNHAVRDDELRNSLNKLSGSLEPVLKDYDRRMGIKKWTDKVIWALISILIVGAVSFLKVTHDDAKIKDEQLQKIQQTLLKQNEAE